VFILIKKKLKEKKVAFCFSDVAYYLATNQDKCLFD